MKSPHSIAVLGAGSWGTALAMVLARNGYSVHLWDHNHLLLETLQKTGYNEQYLPGIKLPDKIKVCHTLADALDNTETSLIVVPSHGFKGLLKKMRPLISAISPLYRIMWATKGLEPSTGEFFHTIVAEELGEDCSMAVLSGPSFAKEVALGLPTAVMLASNDSSFLKEAAGFFRNEVFSVDTTDDLIGVQLGGVVKNILAVAAGLAEGLGFGANARAALITRGLLEMMHLGSAVHAKPETFMGLAGCGDSILTCTDNQSRNRRLGLALAQGCTIEDAQKQIGQSIEAMHSLVQIMDLAHKKQVRMPIVMQVYRIIKQGVAPKEAILSLFSPLSQNE